MKQAIKRTLFGFVLGMAIGNVIAALTGHPAIVSAALLEKTGSLPNALLAQTLCSGLIGAAGMGGTVLYELERLPLLVTDALHFALCMAVFVPVARCLGWTDTPRELLALSAIMLVVHLAIFLIMCVYYRSQVRIINELQKQCFSGGSKIGEIR
ncbi:MAG: DUF3021 domain-containing protein [Oscillospiraceae bacterium]|nr:DUF3021 domain-containing protein [Oscillospiraceae bacterium]